MGPTPLSRSLSTFISCHSFCPYYQAQMTMLWSCPCACLPPVLSLWHSFPVYVKSEICRWSPATCIFLCEFCCFGICHWSVLGLYSSSFPFLWLSWVFSNDHMCKVRTSVVLPSADTSEGHRGATWLGSSFSLPYLPS